MEKLTDLNNKFLHTKQIGSTGESLASKTLQIMHDIDVVLEEFAELKKNPSLMNELTNAIGGSEMEYSMAIAMILGKAKADIEAL